MRTRVKYGAAATRPVEASDVRSLAAEAAGSFLVLAGGAGITQVARLAGVPGVAAAAFGYGFAVALGVALFARLSRAHFNPAVTAAFLATGRIRWILALGYAVAQLTGFLAAAVLLAAVGPGSGNVVSAPSLATWAGEGAAAFLLMAVIAWAAWSPRPRWVPPFAIGGAVAAAILLFARLSGAGMNPARALAPWLVSGGGPGIPPYLVAPFVGALAAAGLHRLANRAAEPRTREAPA
jgi:glycerol uptake facilitator-like aquaporin